MLNQNHQNKRKVPVLRISLTKGNDYGKICEVSEFKDIVMNETLVAIKYGLEKKKDSIELFEISDSKVRINIDKNEWKPSLKTVMDYFTSLEDYNKAIECRELMKKI